jgi:hypothetical protein
MLSPTNKLKARASISDFCTRAEVNRLRWFYDQIRPFKGLGVVPEAQHIDDCSAYCALAFYWAVHHNPGVWMNDPLNENYSGYGNTGTALSYLKIHPAPSGKYMVGDMAIFGTASLTVHMIICRKAGTGATAIFSSNGHESFNFPTDAPNPMSLNEAKALQPLVGVYRHPALL